jgi:SAM-dependent methyltransferase
VNVPGQELRPPPRPAAALDLSRYPNVFEAAFSWDRSAEARSYLWAAWQMTGKSPTSAVELACGTAPIARRWASWGVEVFGVDRSASAIAWARRRDPTPGGRQKWIVGEIQDFRLPHRVDLAALPMDGLGYLTRERELLGFFRSVGRCLRPGGVLAIDLTLHRTNSTPTPFRNTWKVQLSPRGALDVEWRSRGKPWGTPRRRWEAGKVTVRIPGEPKQVFWEARPHAMLSGPDLRDLAQRAGGFDDLWLFSEAAHRAPASRLRRVVPDDRIQGSRLACWRRS